MAQCSGEANSEQSVFLQYNSISIFAFGAIMIGFTFVPIFLKDVGASNFEIGVVAISYALMSVISSWMFGRASDVLGQRKIFIEVGLAASSLSFLLQIFGNTFMVMLLARGLLGFSIGIFPPALIAYAYEARGRMGKFASFGSLGWGVGALGGSVIAELLNLEAVFVFGSGLFAIAYVITLLWLPDKRTMKSDHAPVSSVIRENLAVYLAMLIRHSSAFAIWTFWPIFLMDIGASLFEVGLIQSANMLVQFVVMQFIGKYLQHVGNHELVVTGLILSFFVFAGFAIFPEFWIVFLLQVVLGTAWSALYVGSLKSVTETSNEHSTAAGLLRSVQGLSAVLGPIAGTILVFVFSSYTSTMFFAAFMTLIALAVFIPLSSSEKSESFSSGVS